MGLIKDAFMALHPSLALQALPLPLRQPSRSSFIPGCPPLLAFLSSGGGGSGGAAGGLKFTVADTCERIKEEFNFIQQQNHSLKIECEKLASEKTEMQRHYVMVRHFVSSSSLCKFIFVLRRAVAAAIETIAPVPCIGRNSSTVDGIVVFSFPGMFRRFPFGKGAGSRSRKLPKIEKRGSRGSGDSRCLEIQDLKSKRSTDPEILDTLESPNPKALKTQSPQNPESLEFRNSQRDIYRILRYPGIKIERPRN
ncbi:hypothetical protein K0M31_002864 [Melipona bicolor]|uniref:Groucho/TLE N-terminal Q-rich domain-containing protein n=1 Tax=Melipona bicolor TaxID=60889 RepID=A0AA40KQ10_9HYME|nr:hypothetical protein K0M31_002864 [Melipona bicolor]